MCKINWIIILDYIKVLIWPLLVITFIFINRKILKDFLQKIVYKSNKVEIGPFSFDFDKEELGVIFSRSKDKDEIVKNVNEYLNYQALNYAVGLAEAFLSSNKQERDRITTRIKELVRDIDIVYVYEQSELDKFECKLVLLISILQKFELDKDFPILDKENIHIFIVKSLTDDSSFIRFKASQIFYLSEKLSVKYMDKIKSALKSETNLAVQRILKFVIIFYN